MELKFTNTSCDCLEPVLQEVQNLEQTQQIRIPDGLPDIGRVVGAWGQPVIRGKDWRHDSIGFSGGMLVWVLYAPEDGSVDQVVTGWIPFQCRWDLPEEAAEGQIRLRCLPRSVDGRTVSPRKLLVRAGMAVLAEAFSPVSIQTAAPSGETGDIQILRERYPLRLNREAGEKAFSLEETLTLPQGSPHWQTILSCTLEPVLTECRVLTDKLVCRGFGKLKLLCRFEDGQVAAREFDLPFSQYAQLQGTFDADPAADIAIGITSLEPELEEDGQLRIKCGLIAQYLITDREMLEVLLDAYSLKHELKMLREEARFPVVLDSRRENLYGERTIQGEAAKVADARYLPDFPRIRAGENGTVLTVPGRLQLLCEGADGQLFTMSEKWDLEHTLEADEECTLSPVTGIPELQSGLSSGSVTVKGEVPLYVTAAARQGIPMVTSAEAGPEKKADPARPSLVLMRAGTKRLWDMAKENATTVEAIQNASGLSAEPEPGRMLLIPIP